MRSFISVVPWYASCSTESMTMLPEIFSSSTMVVPTISVMFPEPVTVRIGSEYTLPGFVMIVPDVVTVMSAAASA